jgi:hypothetical protein
MVEVDLLDFVETFKRLAKQALGKHAGEPATGGFARWKHVVIHGFRREEEHSFRETVASNWAKPRTLQHRSSNLPLEC